jgi:protein TonB
LLNGKPVEVETTISVVYSLAGPRKETSGKAAAPPAPAEKTAPGTVRLGAQVQAGKLVHRVLPVYPPMAKRAKISGTVVLKALIGKDGSVEKLKYVSGPPPLVRSAMKAVRQWQYAPTHLKGKPVKVDTVIRVVYSLGDKKRPANAKGSGGR